MSCNCAQNDLSSWSGITRVSSDNSSHQLPESGIHLAIRLNSFHEDSGIYIYALSIGAIELSNNQMTSRWIYSGNFTDTEKFGGEVRSLKISSQSDPFKVVSLTVAIKDAKETDVLEEMSNGRFGAKSVSINLLKLKAKILFFGNDFEVESDYAISPNLLSHDCFVIRTKCIHDRCGPSWAHTPCRYRCVSAVGDCHGNYSPWHETGETCTVLPCFND